MQFVKRHNISLRKMMVCCVKQSKSALLLERACSIIETALRCFGTKKACLGKASSRGSCEHNPPLTDSNEKRLYFTNLTPFSLFCKESFRQLAAHLAVKRNWACARLGPSACNVFSEKDRERAKKKAPDFSLWSSNSGWMETLDKSL